MNNAIIFLSIFVIFISIMLIITIDLVIDLYGNYICIKVKIYGLTILNIYISIIGLYIKINNSKKLKTLNLVFNKDDEYLFLQMKKSIFDKLYFDKIAISSTLGFGNASATAQSVSILDIICTKIQYHQKLNNNQCDFWFCNNADFVNNTIVFKGAIKVYFTIFDLIFAIISSFYKRGKYVKERQRKK